MMRVSRLMMAAIAGGCLIAGVAIGMLIPRHVRVEPSAHGEQGGPVDAAPRSIGRNVYSPVILADGYVHRKHLEMVTMLERQCRASGENCELAAAARRAIGKVK